MYANHDNAISSFLFNLLHFPSTVRSGDIGKGFEVNEREGREEVKDERVPSTIHCESSLDPFCLPTHFLIVLSP